MTGAAIPEGSVVITPTEMYREMLATHQAVRDVSGKLDGALDAHARRLDGIDKDFADHEARIRHQEQTAATKQDVEDLQKNLGPRVSSVERRMYLAIGAASAGSGGVVAGLMQLFGKH